MTSSSGPQSSLSSPRWPRPPIEFGESRDLRMSFSREYSVLFLDGSSRFVIVANIPARLLIKPLGQPGWLMFHLVLAGSIASCLSRTFWRFARRHYSSKLVKGLGPGARDCSFFAGKSLLAPPGKCP